MEISEHMNQELEQGDLRRFGLTFAVFVAGIFGFVIPLVFGNPSKPWPLWPWPLSLALAGWAIVAPSTLRQFYRLWMQFGLVMSRITTPVIMGIVYFALITPIALIFRIFRRDAMARKIDGSKKSYRVQSAKTTSESLRRPF